MADRESKVNSDKAQILNWHFTIACGMTYESFFVVQSLSHILLVVTQWTAAWQAPLSAALSRSFLKFMSIESVVPSNHLILGHPALPCLQSFPASGSLPMRWLFTSGGQSTGASTSASVLPINTLGWSPLGLTGLVSLQSKGLSRVLSSTTIWKYRFLAAQPSSRSNSHICTWLLEKP